MCMIDTNEHKINKSYEFNHRYNNYNSLRSL